MKTKLYKIISAGLALVLVFTLAFALLPTNVKADEGNMAWVGQPTPSVLPFNMLANGTDVTEIAIGPDGMTMYAIDGNVNLTLANAIYKSADGGQTWNGLAAVPGALAMPPGNVAVAPDNPDVLAVSCFDAGGAADDVVYISTDGGVTWATLPGLNNSGVANALRVTDLKVGPARGGTIYSRDYMVATAEDTTPAFAGGSLQILGETATWTVADDLGFINATGTHGDFVACEFSPNFVGDRIIFGIYTEATPNTFLYTLNVQNYSVAAPTEIHAAVTLDNPAGTPIVAADYVLPAAGDSVMFGDIAVPSNFDITPGFERAFASVATFGATAGGVWRCDSLLVTRELGMAGTQVRSIAYAGDTANGTLFAGQMFTQPAAVASLATQVWSTTQMTSNMPSWYPSFKPPTGGTAVITDTSWAYVRVSPTFSADSTVYCGTTDAGAGLQSAFSVSTDAGNTFNQEALIDTNDAANTVLKIDGIALSPDGAKLFMATDDGADLSLWETPSAPAPFTWKRIFCFTGAAGVLAINKATWADAPEIYFAETNTVANRLYASYDGGAIFSTRSAPVIGAALRFMSVESSKVLYTAFATNVFKSTNGGSVWSSARPAFVGNIFSVIPAPGGDVLVGGTAGGASISTDGGETFAQLPPGLTPTGNYVVIPDEGYAENGFIYAGDITGSNNGIFRLQVGVEFLWESIANPNATLDAIVGMGMSNGALYGMGAANGCDRTLAPHLAVGDLVPTWGTMDQPAAPAVNFFDVAQNKCYASDNTVNLFAYNDYYATSATTISTPASGAVITVDPVTGRASTLPFSWSAVGTGTGLATNYMFAIYEKAQGFPGAIMAPTAAMPVPSVPSNAVYPGAALAPDINYTFLGGVEYGIQIMAINQVSTDLIGSAWSDPVFISIEASSGVITPPHAGPIWTSPQGGDQGVKPDCALSWAPMSGVTEYELIVATDAALTSPVAGTPVTLATSAFGPVELEYDTDYYAAVRATAPTSSVQSIVAFRTSISPEELAPPVIVETPTISPAWIWAVVIIGAILVIAVVALIFSTRRTP